jgi:Beta-galactosidase
VQLGLTYSAHEARYRNLQWQETFGAALDAAPSLVRLGAYWNEIEPVPGVYEFSNLDWLLDQAEARQQRVLLTIGMKAPRWPEYYLPRWLMSGKRLSDDAQVTDKPAIRAAALRVVATTVEHVRGRSNIAAWQVENEPLDPAGPHRWTIGFDFLDDEIALVRAVDFSKRPVVVNMFVETQPVVLVPAERSAILARARQLASVADIVGMDVYPSRTIDARGRAITVGWPSWIWAGLLGELRDVAAQQGKDAWIVEAQAEPWVIAGKTPPTVWPGTSVAPASVSEMLNTFQGAGYRTILLWGVEHWEAKRQLEHDSSWWIGVTALFARSVTA